MKNSNIPPQEVINLMDQVLRGLYDDSTNWHYVTDFLNDGNMPHSDTFEDHFAKTIEKYIVALGIVHTYGGGNSTPNGYLMLKLGSDGFLLVKSNESVVSLYSPTPLARDLTEREKRDIILRGLYENRHSGKMGHATQFLPELNKEEEGRITSWLEAQGYVIRIPLSQRRYGLKIQSDGVEFCEEDSNSRPGSPILMITNIITSNSPGAIIKVALVENQVSSNESELINLITSIKEEAQSNSMYTAAGIHAIGQCLDEILDKHRKSESIPAFYWDTLSKADTALSLMEKIEIFRTLIDP
jgi:hypothetical protein